VGEDRDAPDPAMKTTIDEPSESAAERRIGAYRVLRELGHGGMGTVYLAARADDQYQKRVAIKVVRGLDSDQIVRHFRRERQILAALDHPNIARLLDGGTTEDGLPYFVMERVEGEPIDSFCDGRKLSVQERLKLFQGVCAAVQYAHQNLVVHRDLKPKNILVDAQGVPKLLDFGIAKLLNPEISGEAATGTVLAMTPEYASPEQMRGQPITTATDVYSLGVVLYELLTGHRPYGRQARDSLELLRAVCEEEPERPSTAVGRTEQRMLPDGAVHTTTPESASRTREGTPEKLRRRLRGDLDNIMLMALRKEPQRRYRSVEAFSEDIRCYLEGRPVTAHKATVWYRTGKFVRRNALGVGAAAAVFLLAVGFGVVTAVQSQRIARERDRANQEAEASRQVSDFLTGLFKVSDPSEARGNSVTAREILDKGADKITRELQGQPLVQAKLMHTIGKVYQSLGLFDPAQALLEKALETRIKTLGPDHPDVAITLSDLGTVVWRKGDFARAKVLQEQALAIREKRLGPDSKEVAESLHSLGNLNWSQGNYDEARHLLERALTIREKILGPEHADVAGVLNSLGAIAYKEGDYKKAEELWQRTLAIREKALGPDHPWVAQTLNNLATVYTFTGNPKRAVPLLERVIQIQEKVLGPKHPDLASGLMNLGDTIWASGDPVGAKTYYARAVAIQEAAGPDNPELARFLDRLARVTLKENDLKGARELYERSLAVRQKALGPKNYEVADSFVGLADCASQAGRLQEAETLYERALALARKPDGTYYPEGVEILDRLAALLRTTGRDGRAAEMESLARSLEAKQ